MVGLSTSQTGEQGGDSFSLTIKVMGVMNKPNIAGNLKAEGAPLWPFNSQAHRDPAQEPQHHLCLFGMLMAVAVVTIYWIHPVFPTLLNSMI